MALDARTPALLDDLLPLTAAALPEVEALFVEAREALRDLVTQGGKISGPALEANQYAAHALSWLATYTEALRQMRAWALRLAEAGSFGEMEGLLLQIAYGEYLTQIQGGIPMSQGEMARLSDLGVTPPAPCAAVARLMAHGNTHAARERLVTLMRDNHGRATFGATGLDEELEMIRDQFRRYAEEKVIPVAHQWHLDDQLIRWRSFRIWLKWVFRPGPSQKNSAVLACPAYDGVVVPKNSRAAISALAPWAPALRSRPS
jgi:(2S)-methylsuccinyl-CoA dehydrogenase